MNVEWDNSHLAEEEELHVSSFSSVFGEEAGDTLTPVYVLVHKNVKGEIKPRRGTPEVVEEEFFHRLQIPDNDGRVFFYKKGGVNDWPGLELMHLVQLSSLTEKKHMGGRFANPEETMTYGDGKELWSLSSNKEQTTALPEKPEITANTYVAKLLLPKHFETGFTSNNDGFVFYYTPENKKMCHGRKILDLYKSNTLIDPEVVQVYHFAHRYAKVNESTRDKFNYHTAVMAQFDDGTCSIYELAWRFTIGATKGGSNWVDDQPAMFEAMSKEMIQPWQSRRSEIRITDLPTSVKDRSSFLKFLALHSGKKKRFLNPSIKEESDVMIRPRKKSDLARYILQRLKVDAGYSEPRIKSRKMSLLKAASVSLFKGAGGFIQDPGFNCQTFSSAFFAFLTGKNSKNDFNGLKAITLSIGVPSDRVKWFTAGEEADGQEARYVEV